jgi:hypothetical protein
MMLEMKDDHHSSLPFGCLVTRICQHYVLDIPALEPVQRLEDSFGKHRVMKSNVQLPRVEERQIAKSPPPTPPAQFDPSAASSSQVVPSPAIEEMFSRIMGQQQTLQRQYLDLDARVQQINLNVKRLQHLEHKDDDEDE